MSVHALSQMPSHPSPSGDDSAALEARVREYFVGRDEVVAVYLFGSQTKGKATQESDVDLALLLSPQFDLQAHFMYRIERAVELEPLVRRPVDVVILNQATLVLCNQILRYGRLIYERDHKQRVVFEVRSRQAYYDFQPMLTRLNRALVRRIKEVGLGNGYRGHRDPLEDARRAFERFESLAKGDI